MQKKCLPTIPSRYGKALFSVMVLFVLFCLLSLSGCAPKSSGSLHFEKAGNVYTVRGIGTFTGSHVVIPEAYDGLPVTSIAASAFKDADIESISLPTTIDTIGANAFEGSDIEAISLPASLVTIGDSAFLNCKSLNFVESASAVLSLVGKDAFLGTPYIEEDSEGDWQDGILYLNNTVVRAASSLSGEIRIREGTMTIAYQAFRDTPIEKVTFPSGLYHSGKYSFYGCASLKEVVFEGVVGYLGEGLFYDCAALQAVTLPGALVNIEDKAFSGCSALTAVTFNQEVQKIGRSAFSRCSSLQTVILSDTVLTIGEEAFLDCTALTAVSGARSLQSIGKQAFFGCTSLTGFALPTQNVAIGQLAFDGCPFAEK